MIAYRAEIWCNGDGKFPCFAGNSRGTSHDSIEALPGLAQNWLAMLIDEGWTVTKDGQHLCPKHSGEAAGASQKHRREG